MIRYNNLEFYDHEFRKLLGNRTLNTFEQLASADADTTLLPGAEGNLASPFEG
jgi:Bax protein